MFIGTSTEFCSCCFHDVWEEKINFHLLLAVFLSLSLSFLHSFSLSDSALVVLKCTNSRNWSSFVAKVELEKPSDKIVILNCIFRNDTQETTEPVNCADHRSWKTNKWNLFTLTTMCACICSVCVYVGVYLCVCESCEASNWDRYLKIQFCWQWVNWKSMVTFFLFIFWHKNLLKSGHTPITTGNYCLAHCINANNDNKISVECLSSTMKLFPYNV